jgi:hypothetical protein
MLISEVLEIRILNQDNIVVWETGTIYAKWKCGLYRVCVCEFMGKEI